MRLVSDAYKWEMVSNVSSDSSCVWYEDQKGDLKHCEPFTNTCNPQLPLVFCPPQLGPFYLFTANTTES